MTDPQNVLITDQQWYIDGVAAGKPQWYGPYYYPDDIYTSGKETDPVVWMSAFTPLTLKNGTISGLCSGDYILSHINGFLRALELSPNSRIYIIETETSYMVSSSDKQDKVFNISSDGQQFGRYKFSQSSIPAVRYMASQIESSYGTNVTSLPNTLQYSIGQSSYIIKSTTYRDEFNLRWTIMIVMSVDDYMGPVIQFRNIVLIINAVVIVLSIIVGLLISVSITRPLTKLGEEMESLRNIGERSASVEIVAPKKQTFVEKLRQASLFYEVSILQKHFRKMSNAVHGFIKYVPAEVVSNFINMPLSEQARLFRPGVSNRHIAILFTDIEGFTCKSRLHTLIF